MYGYDSHGKDFVHDADDDDDDDDDVDVVDDDGDDVGATCVMTYVQNVCFLLLYFQDFCK